MPVTPVVFVHGGMHGSWCWDPVLPYVQAPATTVDLPGRGRRPAELSNVALSDCVDAVLEDADQAGFTRFVLVAHSLGGVTVTETAYQHPERVAALIYVGALIPGPEQSASELMTGGPLEEMPVLPEELARTLFGTGMSDEVWAEHYAGLVPDAPGIMNAKLSGYPTGIPTTYVSMALDQPVPPPLASQMVANLGPAADHRVIPECGHTIMATHPSVLADIVNEVATSADAKSA